MTPSTHNAGQLSTAADAQSSISPDADTDHGHAPSMFGQLDTTSNRASIAPLHVDDLLASPHILKGVLVNLRPVTIPEFRKVCT